MHRAAAHHRAAAGTCAKFSQGHPNRHDEYSLVPEPFPAVLRQQRPQQFIDRKVQKKLLSSMALTTTFAGTCTILSTGAAPTWLMYHEGTELIGCR
jgi:hypothetical protein